MAARVEQNCSSDRHIVAFRSSTGENNFFWLRFDDLRHGFARFFDSLRAGPAIAVTGTRGVSKLFTQNKSSWLQTQPEPKAW